MEEGTRRKSERHTDKTRIKEARRSKERKEKHRKAH